MTPEAARASYRRQLSRHGETITIRRKIDGVTSQVSALARLVHLAPEELVGGLTQKSRKAIVLAEDVAAVLGFLPFRSGVDQIVVGGTVLTVTIVDDTSRRIAGQVIAFELIAG